MKKRRVVITGLGVVSPVGNNVNNSWSNIVNGVSGITLIENINTENQSVKFGGVIKNLDISQYLSPKEAKKWIFLFITVWLLEYRLLKTAD